ELAPGTPDQLAELAPRLGDGVLRAGDGDPERCLPPGRELDLVAQPAARSAAEGAVVAVARHRVGLLGGGAAAPGAEGAEVARSRRARPRDAVGADDRRVGVVGRLAREPPGVAEEDPAPVRARRVGRVVA